jgi:ATP-dependent DNA helicase RecQ
MHGQEVKTYFTFIEIIFTGTPVAALTATADERTLAVVEEKLILKNPFKIIISPNRQNIRFSVEKYKKEAIMTGLDWIVEAVKQHSAEMPRTIIFYNTMNDIGCVVNYLMLKLDKAAYAPQQPKVQGNCLVGIYHSNSWERNKKRVLDSLKVTSGKIRVVVASSALSMGVNFPSIRYIINFGPARNILEQHQEIGRAGRDGLQSHARIIYHGHQLSYCEEPVKDFVKTESCLRVAAYKVLDDRIQPLQQPHLCCKNCSALCDCQEEQCLFIPPEFERDAPLLSELYKVPDLTRPVSNEDMSDLKGALDEIKHSLTQGSHLLDNFSGHSFSPHLVDDVVKNCSRIFTIGDILDTCPVFSFANAIKILEVIQEIFLDIPNFDYTMELLIGSQSKVSKKTYLWELDEALKDVNVHNELSSDSDDDLSHV